MNSKRQTQADRILDLLSSSWYQTKDGSAEWLWVPLPQILSLQISQYNARIHELRKRGLVIELRDEWKDGQRRTAYRLVKP